MQANIKQCQQEEDPVQDDQYYEANSGLQKVTADSDEQWLIFHGRIFDMIEVGNQRQRKDIDWPVGERGPA